MIVAVVSTTPVAAAVGANGERPRRALISADLPDPAGPQMAKWRREGSYCRAVRVERTCAAVGQRVGER